MTINILLLIALAFGVGFNVGVYMVFLILREKKSGTWRKTNCDAKGSLPDYFKKVLMVNGVSKEPETRPVPFKSNQ